ncbi:MAG: PAS domain-containing protein [Anaerolineae bacterium]|nr:PAS domain-containing protein [Anaerolineae bacterium]
MDLINRDTELKQYKRFTKGLTTTLVKTFLLTFAVMNVYQFIKHLIWPNIDIWTSHMITNLISSTISIVAGYSIWQRFNQLNQRIKNREQELNILLENSQGFIATVSIDGTIHSLIPTPPPEIKAQTIGSNIHDYVPLEYHSRLDKAIQNVFETGKTDHFEVLTYNLNGNTAYYSTRVTPIEKNGKITGLSLFGNDVSRHKHTEQLLQALNQVTLAMQKAMTPIDIFTAVVKTFERMNFDCAILVVEDYEKPQVCPQYLRYETQASSLGHKLLGIEDQNLVFNAKSVDLFWRVICEKESQFTENVEETLRQLIPPGHEDYEDMVSKTIQALALTKLITAPLIIEDNVIGILVVTSDTLTKADIPTINTFAHQVSVEWRKTKLMQDLERNLKKRRETEAALRETYARLQTLLQAIPDIVYFKDTQGRYQIINRAFEKLVNAGEAEIIGRTDKEIANHHFTGNTQESDQIVFEERCPHHIEEQFKDSQECERYFDTIKAPIYNSQGDLVGLVGVSRDITDRKHMEEDLRQRTLELESRNQDLDAFSRTVAHDLKAPLSPIVGYAELISMEYGTLLSQDSLEDLNIIIQSGHKMGSIIDELLLLAGLRDMKPPQRPINMAAVLSDVLQHLNYIYEGTPREIKVPETWPVAWGYAPWIEEVWMNYLTNAIKYGGQPPKIVLGASNDDNGMIRFWIKDNGPGLKPEEQAQLFNSFARLETTRAKGHGLGLSIVKRIIEKLGGEVGIESIIGEGSTFFFTLPTKECKN